MFTLYLYFFHVHIVLPHTAIMFSKREVIKIIQRLAEEDKLPKPKNGPGTGTGFRRGTKVKNRFKIDSEIDKRPEYHLHFPEVYNYSIFGPLREKTCLLGFRQSDTQTVLLSYKD